MESTGKYWIPVFNVLEETCWVVLAHPKYTKPLKGNKTDRKDAKWICDLFMCDMVKPSFIPPPDIRQRRDLMRYRVKLTNIITGEKNRASNCLTVSNLKLNDVFSDVFGKSSRSIIYYILEHPGEAFDVAPFVDRRCKHPIEEIQAAVDGAVSRDLRLVSICRYSLLQNEFQERYRRIKAHRGHQKAIIAICRMFLTAIWNVLSKGEPYSAEGYLSDAATTKNQVLTTQQALNLLKSRGYIIKDDPPPGSA